MCKESLQTYRFGDIGGRRLLRYSILQGATLTATKVGLSANKDHSLRRW